MTDFLVISAIWYQLFPSQAGSFWGVTLILEDPIDDIKNLEMALTDIAAVQLSLY